MSRIKAPFKIKANKPMPVSHIHDVFECSAADARHDNDRPYPFETMERGDSFVVPAPTDYTANLMQRRVSAAACIFRDTTCRSNVDFATRKVKTGVQIWRIA